MSRRVKALKVLETGNKQRSTSAWQPRDKLPTILHDLTSPSDYFYRNKQ